MDRTYSTEQATEGAEPPVHQWPAPTARPPYEAAFTGFTGGADLDSWPNSVTVDVTLGYGLAGGETLDDEFERFADGGEVRQLVEIDTNYKPGRQSEYPVALTRWDAVDFAVAVLRAVEGTFDRSRAGRLRAREAADLLERLSEVDAALLDLREHALRDLREHALDHELDDNVEDDGDPDADPDGAGGVSP